MTDVQKKVTSVVNKAANDLNKATDSLNKTLTKAVSDLNGLTEVSTDLAYEIELKSAQLEELDAKYSDTVRKKEAELKLQVLENEDKLLDQLMKARGLAKISQADLHGLEEQITHLETTMDETINKQVYSKFDVAKAILDADLHKQKAEYEVSTAKLKADLDSAVKDNERLIASESRLLKMIDDEREARVKMSANAQAPVFNVPTGK